VSVDHWTRVVFLGGPYDGRTSSVNFCGLRAPMDGYGWKHRCGHDTFAVGWYDEDGRWEHPERDVVVEGSCPDCWKANR